MVSGKFSNSFVPTRQKHNSTKYRYRHSMYSSGQLLSEKIPKWVSDATRSVPMRSWQCRSDYLYLIRSKPSNRSLIRPQFFRVVRSYQTWSRLISDLISDLVRYHRVCFDQPSDLLRSRQIPRLMSLSHLSSSDKIWWNLIKWWTKTRYLQTRWDLLSDQVRSAVGSD